MEDMAENPAHTLGGSGIDPALRNATGRPQRYTMGGFHVV